ncbi:MAG: hypothetical protein ACLU4J_20770 [Butyricimonas paravirosa]
MVKWKTKDVRVVFELPVGCCVDASDAIGRALPYAERAVTVEAGYPWGWLVYSKLLYGCQRTEEALEAAEGLVLMPGMRNLLH